MKIGRNKLKKKVQEKTTKANKHTQNEQTNRQKSTEEQSAPHFPLISSNNIQFIIFQKKICV